MRIETRVRELFTFDELDDKAKEKARDWFRNGNLSENFTLDEMMDSLKALFKTAGVRLMDWSIGAYNRGNYVKFDLGDAAELTGRRAIAWLENNLYSKVRITVYEFNKKKKEYMGYGVYYRPGKIKPCPFTGVCYDDDLIAALNKSIKSGDTLKNAFKNLADVVGRMNEEAIEYENEDEQVDESIRINEYEFTKDGKRA